MDLYLILLGPILSGLGFKLLFKQPKYNFEKSTDGSTVRFLDYDESRKHKRRKALGKFLIFLGITAIGMGIYVMFFIN